MLSQRRIEAGSPLDTCIVEASHVETFAGVNYEKDPMPCEKVAVKGQSDESDK